MVASYLSPKCYVNLLFCLQTPTDDGYPGHSKGIADKVKHG